MRPSSSNPFERPPFAFTGCYNVSDYDLMYEDGEQIRTREEVDSFERWRERDDLPELTLNEFYEVWQMVVDVLGRFGQVQDLIAKVPYDFYVWEDKFFDRTQKVELVTSDGLAFLVDAIPDLQVALQELPLWRVWFFGTGDEQQIEQTRFVVYPDCVRFWPGIEGDTLTNKLLANIKLRMQAR